MNVRLSPRRNRKFHGRVFHGRGNMWDTVGCGRGDRRTNKQTGRQTDGHCRCV